MKKRRIVLLASFVFVAIFSVAIFSREISLCPQVSFSSCLNFFEFLAEIIFPIIFLFIFSLITYKMCEEVYQAWWKFARVWIPISMLAILIAPSYANNWMFPIEKGNVAAFFSLVFVVSSILMIVSRYYSLKNNLKYSVVASFGVFIIAFIIAAIIFLTLAQVL